MTPFNQLTSQGQIRRYHRLARLVLESYPLTVKKLRCISMRHNVIFRVDTDTGTYALKIGYPGIRSREMVQSEMQWLADMQTAGIDFTFSTPIRTKDGKSVVSHEVEGIPEERHSVLMTWLPGRLVSTHPMPQKLKKIGIAMAKLHNFSDTYQPEKPFMTYDAFRCDEWGGLYYLEDSHPYLTADEKSSFKQAIKTAEEALSTARERDGLKLIHADLHLKNTMWYKGNIAVFDFDDCRWGHHLQDLGVILSWFDESTEDGKKMKKAFLKGYDSQRPLNYTEKDLKRAVMHRKMVGLTFVMNYRPLLMRKASEETFNWLKKESQG